MTGGVGVISADIPNNESLSGAFDLGGNSLIAIEFPTNWGGGTQITFQSKVKRTEDLNPNNGQAVEFWRNVYDAAGNELIVTCGANRIVTDIPELAPLRFLRIRSGTSTTPVPQSPGKSLRLIVKQ